MKRTLPRALGIAAELLTALAACVGCTKSSPEPDKPREIHWHGGDTGYEGTTIVQPDEGQERP